MPAVSALTPMGLLFRSWLPSVLRDSPEYLAVIHCYAREFERAELTLEQVRRQFFPQTADILLGVHEAQLRMTVEPEGLSIEQRQTLVMAEMLKMSGEPFGRQWVANVTVIIGAGWSYETYDPDTPGSPDPDTIVITLPGAPDADLYARAQRGIAEITPAHVEISFNFTGGFQLDVGQLDIDELA